MTHPITDFLQARITDAENEATYLRSVGVQGPQPGSVNGALSNLIESALLDAAAKRRIVELHSAVDPCDAHDARFETIPCATLRELASIYADHSDYREEWAC